MEGDNSSAPVPLNGAPAPQDPPIGNIHAQHQAMDTSADTLDQTAPPTHAIHQQPTSYNTLSATISAESPAPSSTAGTPTATVNQTTSAPHPTTAPTTSAVPKDGKAAGQPDFPIPLPSQAQAHGAPVRQYLNENLSPYLLEVTKHVAAHRPQRPLEFVAEYFMEKSRQIEGSK